MATRAERVAADSKERAVGLLTHYMTLVMERAGFKVDGDTYSEIRECVEAIITAAVATVEAENPNVF